MEYHRARIKLEAKAALRRGDPRPWLVTLVYYLLAYAPMYLPYLAAPLLGTLFYLFPGRTGHHWADILLSLGMIFCYILFYLLLAVLSAGYKHYAMNLWRGRRTEVRDLFHAFPMAGKTIRLYLLILLFSLLWGLACLLVLLPMIPVSYLFYDSSGALPVLAGLLCYVGYIALFLNRTLPYALSFYVLMDHPDYTARACLKESKALMAGRRWPLFVLMLSFLGWVLLSLAIFYGAALAGAFLGALLGFFYHGFGALLGLAVLLLSFLCSVPLLLWLTPYLTTAKAGFYDCAAGAPPPAAPAGPPARPEVAPHFYFSGPTAAPTPPKPPAPPAPPASPEPPPRAEIFYSGFGSEDPNQPPEPPSGDSKP